MAKLPGSFKTAEIENRMDYTPIPKDDYKARIIESERVPTKATQELPKAKQKDGIHYYKLTFEIQEGKYKGRKLGVNLNLEHEKENVVEMAQGELASICDACGKVKIDDTKELHNIDIMISVGIKKGDAQYADSNVIRGYKPLKGVKKPKLEDEDYEEEEQEEDYEEEEEEEQEEEQAPAKKPARKVSFD